MDYDNLAGIAAVCMMGAISPGPSLAVVVRNTVSGGRREGVITSIGHGIGFGIYALIAVIGMSTLLENERAFQALQWGGAGLLILLGIMMIKSESKNEDEDDNSGRRGFTEGFMMAFLNPKILVFLTAVFSQFLWVGITLQEQIVVGVMGGVIDGVWYVLVALVLAGTPLINGLRKNAIIVDRVIGTILLFVAASLLFTSLFTSLPSPHSPQQHVRYCLLLMVLILIGFSFPLKPFPTFFFLFFLFLICFFLFSIFLFILLLLLLTMFASIEFNSTLLVVVLVAWMLVLDMLLFILILFFSQIAFNCGIFSLL